MSIEIKVPDIGADEVEVTEVMVKVGDRIEEEQSLITVEGDKASMKSHHHKRVWLKRSRLLWATKSKQVLLS